MKLAKHFLRKCKAFALRFGILLLAMFAISVVGVFGGEVISLPIAIARLTEALGADSFID